MSSLSALVELVRNVLGVFINALSFFRLTLRSSSALAAENMFLRKHQFRLACPGFGKGTYQAFLDKHSFRNPGGNSELFLRVSPGQFKCIRPFKYDC